MPYPEIEFKLYFASTVSAELIIKDNRPPAALLMMIVNLGRVKSKTNIIMPLCDKNYRKHKKQDIVTKRLRRVRFDIFALLLYSREKKRGVTKFLWK